MTTPWGKAGAWADDSERAELEETVYTAPAARIGTESDNFPSLAVAAAAKPKKKKNVPMSLAEFSTGNPTGPGTRRGGGDLGFESKRLTQDEMRMLPTGPKERSAEEMESGRLGGGFRSYGGGRTQGGPPGRDGGGRDGAWGGGGGRRYGGFDDENRSAPPPREDLPSRADEVDNWATTKKTLPSRMDSGGGRDRYGGGLGGGDSGRQDRYSALGGGSRADEVDNWASGKKALPARTNSSSSSFGSGFRDPAATEGDRWTRTGPLPSRDREVEPSRERTRLVFAPPSGGGDGNSNDVAKTTRANPFGAARPREEILAEKGLDYKQLDSDIDTKKTSRPTSSHSSRPTSAHSNRPESPVSQVLEVAAKPRPRVNPFGDAKPREVLLQEKGKDWRKIDFELEHRGVNRPETEEEQRMKDEIERLKIELGKEAAVEENGEQSGLQEIILSKEKELEKLISDLDDKVRFGQKATGFSERPGSGGGRSTGFAERPGSGGGRSTGFPERPGSGGGRNAGYPDRPPSQSGPDVEYIDRPRSRGTGDAWRGPVDDRRGGGYQGGRDGGYQGGRDGGYQGGRDGRYQGGRDGGYQGGRDGGFSSGREDRQRW